MAKWENTDYGQRKNLTTRTEHGCWRCGKTIPIKSYVQCFKLFPSRAKSCGIDHVETIQTFHACRKCHKPEEFEVKNG